MSYNNAAGAALLDWIKLFPIDADISNLGDLADGTVIGKLLLDIDYYAFHDDINKVTPSEQWVVRFQNLKKIHKALVHYYTSNLQRRAPTSSKYAPDLLAIAREGSQRELIKLIKLVVFVAVESERREHYITQIQKLSSTSQNEFMLVIAQMMKLNEENSDEMDKQVLHTSETEFQMEEEISRLVTEKESLENEHKQLLDRFNKSQSLTEELRLEIQHLQDRLTDGPVSSTGQSKADMVLHIQLDQLQADVHKMEDTINERDATISNNENTIKSLNRKVDDLTRASDYVEKLKDDLDTARHTVEKLRKEQNVMQHYKKKLESMPELEKRLKFLEEENTMMQRENVQMEEAIRSNTGDKKLIGTYKKQIERYEAEHAELLKEKQRLELENASMREVVAGAEGQRSKDTEHIQTLEVKVQELENGLIGQASESIQGDLDSEMNFRGVTKTDLKLRINKLERENQQLKETGLKSADSLVLQNLLEDKEKARYRLEQDVLITNSDKLALEAELAALRNGGDIDESSSIVIQLRKNIEERDRIIQETRKQLDDRPPLSVSTGDASISKLINEKDDLQRTIADLKDTLLDSEKGNGELKATLAAIGGSREGQHGELEKRVLQLQDKLEDRREKAIKAREHIKKQNTTIKELQDEIDTARTSDRSGKKGADYETLAARNEILMKEVDLMTSAWYDITSRLQSNTVTLGRRKEAPVSWLGKQRQAVANFPKR
ncbi:hypothetical protein TWF225_001558 [Orbilia oligospora]|uniref:HOOK N-terminal domain-containing protein n=1 Tax=Orbilia oligospora TaxID=2813651 RepID=A0A8H2DRW6_ORBOL|nr:hypothetical protein TWF225_001558 [Orbilia oligospora]KAF3233428.1 hypothetical protein TWF128_003171 [Orbilia oligospora]KAF3271067.1 hypothetical protein TWF217_005491 [Orbilia oligospora]KAF3276715.1 hypothetical protein TWF132_002097 [Orbilia oligospora]TGJ63516.1 hypothetical protein EYR41_011435 [Orbilia oligospora]